MIAGLMLSALLTATAAQDRAPPQSPSHEDATPPIASVRPAVDAIFAAFGRHQIVALGDAHGLAQEAALYAEVIRDPRFAPTVGNLVVEFGTSAEQPVLDRYLEGEDVPLSDLRRVWLGGNAPAGFGPAYELLFAQVRALNMKRLPQDHIHVWLGDPSIDWNALGADEGAMIEAGRRRDEYPAKLIEDEILAHGKKALVIYGSLHLFQGPEMAGQPHVRGIGDLARRHPGAVFVILPYVGYPNPACSAAFEQEVNWPANTIVGPVRGTSLQAALLRPGCPFASGLSRPPGAPPPSPELARFQARMSAFAENVRSGVLGDALLYLGPASSLLQASDDADLVLDPALFRNTAHRLEAFTGRSADYSEMVKALTAPPQPFAY